MGSFFFPSLKSKKLKQIVKKKADFWNVEKQAFEEMN
jgi:hypothetical protein